MIDWFDLLAVQGLSRTFSNTSYFTSLNCLTLSKIYFGASLVAQVVKCLPAMQETWARSLGQEDPLEKEMATHSSIPAWRIPWTEEPGRLQSVGLQKVGHDWVKGKKKLLLKRQHRQIRVPEKSREKKTFASQRYRQVLHRMTLFLLCLIFRSLLR